MTRDTPPLNTVGAEGKPKKARSGKPPHSDMSKYTNVARVPMDKIAETVDPNAPLTPMMIRFVKHWAAGESVSAASARAGYANPSLAYRLTRYPQVLALYAEEKAKFEEAAQMTRKRVMEGLLEGVDMAKLEGEPMAVIAGWREIGRMCGYYEPTKQQIEINVTGIGVMDRLNKLSDADLLRMITENVQTPGRDPLQLVDEVSPMADVDPTSLPGDEDQP